jgi:GT2 family glycosyltransferase
MLKISVIIVSWNAKKFLRGCLDSIRQTRGSLDVEVIVVDNASRDGSPEMVVAEFPEVKLIQTGENLGFAKANNIGIKQATGDCFALVNSDVLVHPECFQRLAGFLDAHPTVGLVGPKVLEGNGALQRTCRRFPTVWNTVCRALALDAVLSSWPLFSGREMRHWSHDEQAEIEVLSGCFWLARRGAVEQVGGLDERFFFYAEDVDWCRRFWDAGWKVMFVPAATATHFGGASSSNAPLKYNIELLRANVTYWRKHSGAAGAFCFRAISLAHHALRWLPYAVKSFGGGKSAETSRHKRQRSVVCMRWLLTGKGV